MDYETRKNVDIDKLTVFHKEFMQVIGKSIYSYDIAL